MKGTFTRTYGVKVPFMRMGDGAHRNVHPPRPVRSVEYAPEGGDGGMGAYFADPSGHNLEIITRPYGSGSATGG